MPLEIPDNCNLIIPMNNSPINSTINFTTDATSLTYSLAGTGWGRFCYADLLCK